MDIIKLGIQNFLTIGEAKLDLQNKGLVLVQGQNLDDPSADSNGSGKSTIPDALLWCLYGETTRGVRGDSVVNLKKKKDCFVKTILKDEETYYIVERYRKHKSGKNALMLYKTDSLSAPAIDCTLGTDKLTQELLNSVLGCSKEVFQAAIVSGQEAMVDLPAMTDKQLKMLVEESAGINLLQSAYDVARKRYNDAKLKVKTVSDLLDSKNESLIDQVERCESLVEKADDWDFNQGKKINENTKECTSIEGEIMTLETKIKNSGRGKIAKELSECEKAIAGYNDEEDKLKSLRENTSKAQSDLKIATSKMSDLVRNINTIKTDIENIEEVVGTPCGECGKVYSESDLSHAISAKKESLKKCAIEAKDFKNTVGRYKSAFDKAFKQAADFESSMISISDVVARQSDLQSQMNGFKSMEAELLSKKSSLKKIFDEGKEISKEKNPYLDLCEIEDARKDQLEKEISKAEKRLKDAEAEFELISDAVEVFGPTGVRAHILDNVTPYLNERTAHYLGSMSDGNIEAIWSTLTKTAKGEIREKFNIEVINKNGANSFAGLSGGEKRKVRIATSMALQDMVASRARKPINFYVADEVDHALDESGLERLMGILDEKARERGTVLVISHNELSDWIREQVTVTKSGGISTVDGVLNA